MEKLIILAFAGLICYMIFLRIKISKKNKIWSLTYKVNSNFKKEFLEKEINKEINGFRSINNFKELIIDEQATIVARLKCREMAKTGVLTHQDSIKKRLYQLGADDVGENIGKTYRTVEALVKGYAKSEKHRNNMLNPNWDAMGNSSCQDDNNKWWYCTIFIKENNF